MELVSFTMTGIGKGSKPFPMPVILFCLHYLPSVCYISFLRLGYVSLSCGAFSVGLPWLSIVSYSFCALSFTDLSFFSIFKSLCISAFLI